jgi:hypothetical protein
MKCDLDRKPVYTANELDAYRWDIPNVLDALAALNPGAETYAVHDWIAENGHDLTEARIKELLLNARVDAIQRKLQNV